MAGRALRRASQARSSTPRSNLPASAPSPRSREGPRRQRRSRPAWPAAGGRADPESLYGPLSPGGAGGVGDAVQGGDPTVERESGSGGGKSGHRSDLQPAEVTDLPLLRQRWPSALCEGPIDADRAGSGRTASPIDADRGRDTRPHRTNGSEDQLPDAADRGDASARPAPAYQRARPTWCSSDLALARASGTGCRSSPSRSSGPCAAGTPRRWRT